VSYYFVEPEVAGGLGESTVMDRSVHPPVVSRLAYRLDGWLGDVLLESFPCFILTEDAKVALQAGGFTGVRFEPVEISTSEEFRELSGSQMLPGFVWLVIEGMPGHDDFGLAPDHRLVVSARALGTLKGLGLAHASIAAWPTGNELPG